LARSQSEPVPMAQFPTTPRHFSEIGYSVSTTLQQVPNLFGLPRIDIVCSERFEAALDMANEFLAFLQRLHDVCVLNRCLPPTIVGVLGESYQGNYVAKRKSETHG
jgi:hypothetical protein